LSLASSLLASFVGKNYTKFRRARARTPRISHGYYTLMLLAKVSLPPFIATRGLTEGEPVTQQCTFYGRIHGSIHRCSQRCNNTDSPNSNVSREALNKEPYISGFIHKVILGVISVAYPIVLFFWDFTRKRGLFRYRI
jgi:hypothetical protein